MSTTSNSNNDFEPIFNEENLAYEEERIDGTTSAVLGYDEDLDEEPEMAINYRIDNEEIEIQGLKPSDAKHSDFSAGDYLSMAEAAERTGKVDRDYELPEAVADYLEADETEFAGFFAYYR